MTSKVTFDSTTLTDAVQKAAKIAPTKGAAFDKAAGIVIEVSPNDNSALVKSTDIDTTYQQRIEVVKAEGDPVAWRIPSAMLVGIVSNLPSGEGKQITLFDQGDSFVRIKQDRFVAKVPTYDPKSYPTLPIFDMSGMVTANDLASKISQVAWACESNTTKALGGVHVDGTRLIGCNQAAMAIVDCEVEVEHPVTVSLATMAQLLRQGTDVKIKAEDKRLVMMLDAETRATAQLIEEAYPDITKVFREEFYGTVAISKQEFVDAINRLLVLARQEKAPAVRLDFNSGGSLLDMLTLDIEAESGGRMQDSINMSTEWSGQFEIWFTPTYIIKAIDASKADTVMVDFGVPEEHPRFANSKLMPIRIRDNKGYFSWVMPRNVSKPSQ